MEKNLEIFFSNQLEVLYQQLKSDLFGSNTTPLMRRLVIVYGPAMKTWLMLKMAQDADLNIAMGIEFIYISQAFEILLKLTSNKDIGHLPSFLELAFAIENELTTLIYHFKNLTTNEQRDWLPLIDYLKINPYHLGDHLRLSLKIEKRLIALSQHLAYLFQNYGRFAPKMLAQWKLPNCSGWQSRLWRRLFEEKRGWTYPICALLRKEEPHIHIPFTAHFFSISFITASEFAFLNRLSKHVSVYYYLLSPCAVFWSDIRSDSESAYLQAYWQQKVGPFSSKILTLEEFLRDRNPLLANFGRMGREMASQIERGSALTHARYILPGHVQMLNEELFMNEDLYLTETKAPLSLLHALQADLLMMRNPQGQPPVQLEEWGSIQLHIASSKRREIQILYHNLLKLIAKDPSLHPTDIIVMAPQIGNYVPYIQSIFGAKDSLLDFQVLDLGMQIQSEIVQGFLQLLELSESRWNISNLLQLFEHASFQRRHHLSTSDYLTIQKWVEQVGIRWGDDWLHRNELLQRKHCEKGMVEETTIGTWDYGLSRLLLGLTTVVDEQNPSTFDEIPPCSAVDFSQSELLGKWIRLLHSLRDDLSLLQSRTRMNMEDWANFLLCLLENYFQSNFEDPQSVEEYDELKAQFEILRNSTKAFKEALYPFTSVKTHLLSLLQHRGMTYREDCLQTVRFCSLVPLRSIPAKVIALLGMQEGAFPRLDNYSSLNLMIGGEEVDYHPLSTDYDRYLFLEVLHAAQNYLLFSYQGYSQRDSKELQPSLMVEELFSYLDRFYNIQGRKVTEMCVFKHPFDSFDECYFNKKADLYNFSQQDFRAAQTYYKKHKIPPHRFLNSFKCIEHSKASIIENNSQIDLKHLCSVARNPIKFYLNKVLEIYVQTEEDRKAKTEEDLTVSSLDKYQMKRFALKGSIDNILYRAEREGKLPFGLFKTVATKRLKEEMEEIYENLSKQSIHPASIFQIEFCASCSCPTQIEKDHWLFPAVSLSYEDGYKLSIVGKLPHVTSKGLVSLSKGSLSDIWKTWPQFLLYCHAAKLYPDQLEPQLILTHSSQPKKAFFDNPNDYLKEFVNYYALCLQNFSPLLPDWIPLILESDIRGLQDKMNQLFKESFGVYQNDDLRWILNKYHLPNLDMIICNWKLLAEKLLRDLIHFWFKSKSELVS